MAMERNIKADTWSSLQAKKLGFFLGILSDLLGLSTMVKQSLFYFVLLFFFISFLPSKYRLEYKRLGHVF